MTEIEALQEIIKQLEYINTKLLFIQTATIMGITYYLFTSLLNSFINKGK